MEHPKILNFSVAIHSKINGTNGNTQLYTLQKGVKIMKHKRYVSILLALLIASTALLTSCDSFCSKYGFNEAYVRSNICGSDIFCENPNINLYQENTGRYYDKKYLNKKNSFEINGTTYKLEYDHSETSITFYLGEMHYFNIPSHDTSLTLNAKGELVQYHGDYKPQKYTNECSFSDLRKYAKEYAKVLRPDINLDEFKFDDGNNPNIFTWRKFISEVQTEILTVCVDQYGNLQYFVYYENGITHVPEITNENLMSLVEETLYSIVEGNEQKVTFKDIELNEALANKCFPGLAPNYNLIYSSVLDSYALLVTVSFTAVNENGEEKHSLRTLLFTYD